MARDKRTRERAGLTLDTGALVALQRRHRSAIVLLRVAVARGIPLRIPAAVVAEFWRGGHRQEVEDLIRLRSLPVDRLQAQRAGEALAAVGRGPSVVDAIVAAVADEYQDDVVTTDPDDLQTLCAHLRRVGELIRV